MRLRDLLDPERVLAISMKLAVCLILFSVVLQLAVCIVRQVAPVAGLVLLCVLVLSSPLAYLIRQKRLGRTRESGARRGAERTPLLPHDEEAQ